MLPRSIHLGVPGATQTKMRAVYDENGVPWSKNKAVEGQLSVTRMGTDVDGDAGYVGNALEKTLRTIALTAWALRQTFLFTSRWHWLVVHLLERHSLGLSWRE